MHSQRWGKASPQAFLALTAQADMLAPKLLATRSSGPANNGTKAADGAGLLSSDQWGNHCWPCIMFSGPPGLAQEAARGCSELILDACIRFLGLL